MSAISDWLSTRRPEPPADLAETLRLEGAEGSIEVALAAAAGTRLAEARARLGRVRASGFRLLEADALMTYACEAALETEDPEGALRRILASAGS